MSKALLPEELYKIENPERVPSGVPDWDYQQPEPTEVFYIEGLGGRPICVEVYAPSKNYRTASAEMVTGLTRDKMRTALVEKYPKFRIDDLYVKGGYMYAQLRRMVMK